MSPNASASITIVIPAYQAEGFLTRALDSVATQSDTDWELIVVDDGSQDGTLALAQRHAARDPARIRVLAQPNAGPAAARNRGMAEAQGEYVLFLDADDALMPDAIARLREDLQTHGPVDFLFGGHAVVRLDGSRKTLIPGPVRGEPLRDFQDFLRGRGVGPTHGALLMRRELAMRLGYPVAIRNNEDVVLFAQMLALGRSRSLPAVLAIKYRRQASLRHDTDALLQSADQVAALLFDPARLPTAFLAERPAFEADRHLLYFRTLTRAGRQKEARRHFHRALRLDPGAALRPQSLFKYLRSLWRGMRAGTPA
jgi:glycosyltransferase involved in cell wall biosynthesis